MAPDDNDEQGAGEAEGDEALTGSGAPSADEPAGDIGAAEDDGGEKAVDAAAAEEHPEPRSFAHVEQDNVSEPGVETTRNLLTGEESSHTAAEATADDGEDEAHEGDVSEEE